MQNLFDIFLSLPFLNRVILIVALFIPLYSFFKLEGDKPESKKPEDEKGDEPEKSDEPVDKKPEGAKNENIGNKTPKKQRLNVNDGPPVEHEETEKTGKIEKTDKIGKTGAMETKNRFVRKSTRNGKPLKTTMAFIRSLNELNKRRVDVENVASI
jgi:hypothetical protein